MCNSLCSSMIKNYYKQSRQQRKISKPQTCDFHARSPPSTKATTPPKQSGRGQKPNQKVKYQLPNGEQKYYKECFPHEYTLFSINNEIYYDKCIQNCKKKEIPMNTTFEDSSEDDQVSELQGSFNPIFYVQQQHSSRFVYSNRERIFDERKTSLSPMQRSLYKRNSSYVPNTNSILHNSRRRIFD